MKNNAIGTQQSARASENDAKVCFDRNSARASLRKVCQFYHETFMCKTEPPRGTLCLMPSLKTNKRRHPNNSVGMGKMSKINKRRAYCYSEVKSSLTGKDVVPLIT